MRDPTSPGSESSFKTSEEELEPHYDKKITYTTSLRRSGPHNIQLRRHQLPGTARSRYVRICIPDKVDTMKILRNEWKGWYTRIAIALLIAASIPPICSCTIGSEQSVCEEELFRLGYGCELFVLTSATLPDSMGELSPNDQPFYDISLAMCLSYLAEKAKCDGKSTTKPDILF